MFNNAERSLGRHPKWSSTKFMDRGLHRASKLFHGYGELRLRMHSRITLGSLAFSDSTAVAGTLAYGVKKWDIRQEFLG